MKKKIAKLSTLILTLCMAISCLFTFGACQPPQAPGGDMTKAEYSQVLGQVNTTYNAYVNSLAPAGVSFSVKKEKTYSQQITDADYVVVDNYYQARGMSNGALWMVRFVKNMCDNSSFELSSGYNDCIVIEQSGSYTYTYKIRFKLSYDKNSGIINLPVLCEQSVSSEPELIYLAYFDFKIDYNVNNDQLNGFELCGFMGDKSAQTKEGVNSFKFFNNTLKTLNPQAAGFEAFANGQLTTMSGFIPEQWSANLPDYSAEYLAAAPQQ